MAKLFNLRKEKPAPPPATPAQAQVPPPATLPPGVKGRLPIPTGQVVTVSRLTDLERKQLHEVGWREGMPIPNNMADIVQEAQRQIQQDLQVAENTMPLPPDQPPVVFKPVPIESLSPARQQEIQQKIDEAMAQQAAESYVPEPTPEVAKKIIAGPRVHVENQPLQRPATNVEPDPNYRPNVAEPVATPEPEPTPAAPAAEAHGHNPLERCPRCHWNLNEADTVKIDDNDKLVYTAHFLGEQMFTKEFKLFDNRTGVTFRVLAAHEVDACFRQTFAERDSGAIKTNIDFFERINRFRVYLQLCRYGSVDLPDGLCVQFVPNAKMVWADKPADIDLPAIEKHILENVLNTESKVRVVTQLCAQFNRMVDKLEAMVQSPDFWKPTDA